MNKWYKNGLAFSCRACGNCCSGPEEGYIWISPEEIDKLADFLKMPIARLKSTYLRREGLRYSIIEKQPSKDCVFLVSDGRGQKTCRIYSVRPLQCRTWPFWKENLRSRKSWDEAGRKCPGIDREKWFDLAHIEAIRDGNLSSPEPTKTIQEVALEWILNNIDNHPYISMLEELYEDIDRHLAPARPTCDNCGKCCDFDRYGHQLYVTTLEMLYFWSGLHGQQQPNAALKNQPAAPDGRCPYQQQGCMARSSRPASCRIFYCRDLPAEFQHDLTEQVLQRLRVMHEKFQAPYYYADLRQWLQSNQQVISRLHAGDL